MKRENVGAPAGNRAPRNPTGTQPTHTQRTRERGHAPRRAQPRSRAAEVVTGHAHRRHGHVVTASLWHALNKPLLFLSVHIFDLLYIPIAQEECACTAVSYSRQWYCSSVSGLDGKFRRPCRGSTILSPAMGKMTLPARPLLRRQRALAQLPRHRLLPAPVLCM